jgi:hypothetical protein
VFYNKVCNLMCKFVLCIGTKMNKLRQLWICWYVLKCTLNTQTRNLTHTDVVNVLMIIKIFKCCCSYSIYCLAKRFSKLSLDEFQLRLMPGRYTVYLRNLIQQHMSALLIFKYNTRHLHFIAFYYFIFSDFHLTRKDK